MSAQIIPFPTKKKVAPQSASTNGALSDRSEMMVCRLKALVRALYPGEFDAKPDLRLVSSEARDSIDERLHRFLLRRGIISEPNR